VPHHFSAIIEIESLICEVQGLQLAPEFIYLCKTSFCVVRKFFPLDKNYLLEEAQLQSQNSLLISLVEKVKEEYFHRYNPLRLHDTVSDSVEKFQLENVLPLNTFYQNLAAIYRFRFGEVQLTFLWDGDDHIKKYGADWKLFFEQSISNFCRHELFIKAVLDLTVFLPENNQAQLAENKMNHFILQHFEVKIHKTRGLVGMKVA
jgi:hypothetical protein